MALNQKEREWLDSQFNRLNDRVTEVRIEIAKLKVKAGIFGIIGGLIPIAILLSLHMLSKLYS